MVRAVNYDANTGGVSQGAAYAWPAGTAISAMISIGVYNILINDIIALASGNLANTGAASGEIYIGKANGTFALATLTPGTNITITNADGAVTIAAVGGGDFLTNQIFS